MFLWTSYHTVFLVLGVTGAFSPWKPSARQARIRSRAFGQNRRRGLRPEYMSWFTPSGNLVTVTFLLKVLTYRNVSSCSSLDGRLTMPWLVDQDRNVDLTASMIWPPRGQNAASDRIRQPPQLHLPVADYSFSVIAFIVRLVMGKQIQRIITTTKGHSIATMFSTLCCYNTLVEHQGNFIQMVWFWSPVQIDKQQEEEKLLLISLNNV